MSLPTGKPTTPPRVNQESFLCATYHPIYTPSLYFVHNLLYLFFPLTGLLVPYQYRVSFIFVSLAHSEVSSMLLALKEKSQMDEYLKKTVLLTPQTANTVLIPETLSPSSPLEHVVGIFIEHLQN